MLSNLVWLGATLTILGVTYRGVRRGSVKLPVFQAMTLALLIGFILLPAISASDDLIDAKQSALPLAAQTWRIASEGASVGLDALPFVETLLFLLLCFRVANLGAPVSQWLVRTIAERLTRSQRLRPPPAFAPQALSF